MKNVYTCAFLLTIVFSINGQTIYKDSIAPKIELTNWINNPNGVKVMNNKPVILEFWATWCRPCVEAIPQFNELADKYKEEIAFVAVNSFETKEIVEKFLAKKPISSFVALDENQNLKSAFNVQNIPVTILIDKDGKLRWRGVTSELSDDLLATFLSQNTFNISYNKGVVLEEDFVVSGLENVNYNLLIEHGDATLGKSISSDSKGKFSVTFSNQNIGLILTSFSDWFSMGDNWQFEGNISEDEVYTIGIKSDTVLKDDTEIKALLNDVITKLAQTFDFNISRNEEVQNIWYIVTDASELEKYRSKNQKLDTEFIEKTEDYLKFKNMSLYYLADFLSTKTKLTLKYEDTKTAYKYDLFIPRSNDILEIKKSLKEKHGISLDERKEVIEIRKAIFN